MASVIAKYLLKRLRGVPDPRVEFDLITNTIELIYRQALVWIGMIWCPFVPFWAMLATFTCFYTKKLCVRPRTCSHHRLLVNHQRDPYHTEIAVNCCGARR